MSAITTKGGKPFAAAGALPTQFRTRSTHRTSRPTPIRIGHWSEVAFQRAHRTGRTQSHGRISIPPFRTTNFTRVADGRHQSDLRLPETREPIRQEDAGERSAVPLNIRLRSRWKLLSIWQGRLSARPVARRPVERGVHGRGVGHCSDCHTPRNRLGTSGVRAISPAVLGGLNAPDAPTRNHRADVTADSL